MTLSFKNIDQGDFNSEFRIIHKDILSLISMKYGDGKNLYVPYSAVYSYLIRRMGIDKIMMENDYDSTFFLEELSKRKEILISKFELELL